MRYAIISDIHANLGALQRVLDRIADCGVDSIHCCGDLVGYYTEPNECIALLKKFKVSSVAGNHDLAAAGKKAIRGWYIAQRAIEWTIPRLTPDSRDFLLSLPIVRVVEQELIIIHGALHAVADPESFYLVQPADIQASLNALQLHPSKAPVAFFGHTHRPAAYGYDGQAVVDLPLGRFKLEDGRVYLVNPGSVGQPREGATEASFVIYDSEQHEIEFIYVPIDMRPVLKKAAKQGLLPDPKIVDFAKRVARKIKVFGRSRDM